MAKLNIKKTLPSMLVTAAAGAGARAINSFVPKSTDGVPVVNGKLIAVGKMLVGAYLQGTAKTGSHTQNIGTALIAIGGSEAAHEFAPGLISGVEGTSIAEVGEVGVIPMYTLEEDSMQGFEDEVGQLPNVSGYEDEMSGYADEEPAVEGLENTF
jgi:hypothetical protein